MTDSRNSRLCLVFAADYLQNISQVAPLCPTATSIHLPRSVDCHFASEQLAQSVHQQLQQTAVAAGQLDSAQLVMTSRKQQMMSYQQQQQMFKDLCRLHVRGLRRSVCRQRLSSAFPGCAHVAIPASNGHGDSGHAFVQFARAELAARYLRDPPMLDGRRLAVSYALERDASRAASSGDEGRFVPVCVDLSQARRDRIEAAKEKQKKQSANKRRTARDVTKSGQTAEKRVKPQGKTEDLES